MKSVFIYILIDPRSGKPRYLGKTSNTKRRLARHLRDVYAAERLTHKVCWLKQLDELPTR